jgi:hypothetical protein
MRLTFCPEHQTSPWQIWPTVQWMLWILLQHWNSWCMRLITYLYFLLRLQMSAVVTVLTLNVFMVYTGTTLPFTIVLEEWLQYLRGIILSYRKWGQCGVMEKCVIIQYCVVWKHRMWLSDDQYRTWKLGKLCMLVFLLCNAYLLSLSLAFSSALALWLLLFRLMIWQLPHCVS